MYLFIRTQNLENYGSVEAPYWKMKWGDNIAIASVSNDLPFVMGKIIASFYHKNLINNTMYKQIVTDVRFEEKLEEGDIAHIAEIKIDNFRHLHDEIWKDVKPFTISAPLDTQQYRDKEVGDCTYAY